jgi:hypothetical protein
MAGIAVAHLGHGRTDMAQVAFEQVRQHNRNTPKSLP